MAHEMLCGVDTGFRDVRVLVQIPDRIEQAMLLHQLAFALQAYIGGQIARRGLLEQGIEQTGEKQLRLVYLSDQLLDLFLPVLRRLE